MAKRIVETFKGIKLPMAFALVVFAVFLCVQAVTVFSLPMFGDDYYYAGFMQSSEYFVSENIRHFKEVNGRVLVHLFAQLLLADKSLTLFGILNIAAIGATVLYTALMGAGCFKREGSLRRLPAALVISCLLFSVLPIEMLRSTAYWLTGSANYLFPMALLVVFTYYTLKALSFRSVGKAGAVMFPLFAFSGAWSTEQASAGMLAVCAYALVMALLYKRKERSHSSLVRVFSVSFIFAAAGFATLMLAPGNSARLQYYPEFFSKNLASRVLSNIPTLLYYSIGKTGCTWLVVLLLLLLPLYLQKRAAAASCNKTSRFLSFFYPFAIASTVFYLLVGSLYGESEVLWIAAALLVGICLAVCFACCVPLIVKEWDMLSPPFILLAVALQAAMLLSPEMGSRTCLCSAVLLFVPVLEAGAYLGEKASKNKMGRLAVIAVCCIISVGAVLSSAITADKYAENALAYNITENNLEKLQNNGGETLVFAVPPNDEYRYILPYDNEYHKYWFKKCHGISEEITIQYSYAN